MPTPVFTTERLILRPLLPTDDEAIRELRSDERVNRFLDRPGPVTIAEAREFIRKISAGVDREEWYYWALSRKGDAQLIGTICLWNLEPDRQQAETGYELHPDHQGRGLMREALTEIIRFGFGALHLQTITACPAPGNLPSRKLLEKMNFQLMDERKDAPRENIVKYALSNPRQ